MKKFFAFVLYALSAVWVLMALFKIYMAIDGYVDHVGRGPIAHLVSAIMQIILAAGAFWLAKRLRKPKSISIPE